MNATSKPKPNRQLWQKGNPPVSRVFEEISKTVACLKIKRTLYIALESFRKSLENSRLVCFFLEVKTNDTSLLLLSARVEVELQ